MTFVVSLLSCLTNCLQTASMCDFTLTAKNLLTICDMHVKDMGTFNNYVVKTSLLIFVYLNICTK